jgi:hypothetical protein
MNLGCCPDIRETVNDPALIVELVTDNLCPGRNRRVRGVGPDGEEAAVVCKVGRSFSPRCGPPDGCSESEFLNFDDRLRQTLDKAQVARTDAPASGKRIA